MLVKIVAAITGVSAVLLGVLLLVTTPADGGPLGILGIFVFMYLTALGVLTFLFRAVSGVLMKLNHRGRDNEVVPPVSFRKAYYRASIIALVPVMIIAMQSVGEVGIYQILLVVFFVTTAWIYVSNRTT